MEKCVEITKHWYCRNCGLPFPPEFQWELHIYGKLIWTLHSLHNWFYLVTFLTYLKIRFCADPIIFCVVCLGLWHAWGAQLWFGNKHFPTYQQFFPLFLTLYILNWICISLSTVYFPLSCRESLIIWICISLPTVFLTFLLNWICGATPLHSIFKWCSLRQIVFCQLDSANSQTHGPSENRELVKRSHSWRLLTTGESVCSLFNTKHWFNSSTFKQRCLIGC